VTSGGNNFSNFPDSFGREIDKRHINSQSLSFQRAINACNL